MTFAEIAAVVGQTVGNGSAVVERLTANSKLAGPGDVFVAVPSTRVDTHDFVAEAMANGAVGAVVHSQSGKERFPNALLLDDFENQIWRLCDALYDHPTRDMKVVGVTGTNGKTTTAWIIQQLLEALGERAAYIGTLGFKQGEVLRPLANTTPFVVDLYNLIVEAKASGCGCLAMEVSSHALAQKRAEGVEFDVAVFTNLTQDHLDFHETMEAYEAAKFRLFSGLPSTKPLVKCLNLDDSVGSDWARKLSGRKIGFRTHFGLEKDLVGVPESVRVDGIEMEMRFEGQTARLSSRLGGSYNAENILSATSAMLGLGYGLDQVCAAFGGVQPVPGRFEGIPNAHGIGAIVDYAHTPDAIEKLLGACREVTTGRVITVFGCGGDRDATKRPLMAAAAERGSDYVIATSDNPRTEDPETILDQVCAGLSGEYLRIADRREAISAAISQAKPGDTVVIAGKGHEDYQIIGREKTPFDDRVVAKEILDAIQR